MFATTWLSQPGGTVLDVEARFDLEVFGVAVYQASDGVLAERVWVVRGLSAGGVSAPHFWHAGQLVLLDESEHPVLGASELVAAPGRAAEGLPGWPRLELFEL